MSSPLVPKGATPARVMSRRPCFYSAGADPARDRPAYVRAGSGCAFIDVPGQGRRLAIVQDDASFIALVDDISGRVDAVELPEAPGAVRQFEKARGNKMDKLDLEACTAIEVAGRPALLAIGSGSVAVRETFVLLRFDDDGRPVVDMLPAPAFFARLREHRAFSGSELNVEGMVLLADGSLRLFNRGNGAPDECGGPVNAHGDVPLDGLLTWLHDPSASMPQLTGVTPHQLGSVRGVSLTFTDATACADGIVFLASAEDSPNAIDDGAVVGTAIGLMRLDGSIAMAPIHDEEGQPLTDKIEGVAIDPARPDRALVVVDRDDPVQPCELLVVTLPTRWG